MKQGYALIIFGAFLLFTGLFYDMVVLVVDDSPPEIAPLLPQDGDVVPELSAVKAYVADLQSGIKSVKATIEDSSGNDIYTDIPLTRVSGSNNAGNWAANLTSPITTPGNYTVKFVAMNNASLMSMVSVSFMVYTDLQGDWLINNQLITSQTQKIYSASLTVSFKFVKTSGVDDSYITAWVEDNAGNTLLTLTYQGNHKWEGSYTFAAGVYTLHLKASDGIGGDISFSIITLDFGSSKPTPSTEPTEIEWHPSHGLMILGLGLIVVGWWQLRKRGG